MILINLQSYLSCHSSFLKTLDQISQNFTTNTWTQCSSSSKFIQKFDLRERRNLSLIFAKEDAVLVFDETTNNRTPQILKVIWVTLTRTSLIHLSFIDWMCEEHNIMDKLLYQVIQKTNFPHAWNVDVIIHFSYYSPLHCSQSSMSSRPTVLTIRYAPSSSQWFSFSAPWPLVSMAKCDSSPIEFW